MIQADSVVTMPAGSLSDISWVLVTAVIAGAVGALAGDLAADGGKLEWVGRDKDKKKLFTLGFMGKMIIGSVAAVAILSVNPPGDSWLVLIGMALAAGIGGEAIVLAFVATGRLELEQGRTQDLLEMQANQWQALQQDALRVASNDASPLAGLIQAHVSAAEATLQAYRK